MVRGWFWQLEASKQPSARITDYASTLPLYLPDYLIIPGTFLRQRLPVFLTQVPYHSFLYCRGTYTLTPIEALN